MSIHGRPGYDMGHGARGFSALPAGGLGQALKAYWHLEEASGNRASEVGSYPLTPHGSPLPGNGAGKSGNAVVLSAAQTQYLEGGNVLHPTGPFTIAAWVNPSSFVSTHRIVTKYDAGAAQAEFSLARHAGGVLLAASTNGSAVVTTNSGGALTLGVWSLVMGWWDGSVINVRVNANEPAAVSFAGPIFSGTAPFAIGTSFTSGSPILIWNGSIDEVGIWDRALTPAERADLYNGGAGKFYPFA